MSVYADYGFWQWILGHHSHCNCWTQRTLQDVLVTRDCTHGILGFVVFCGLPVLLWHLAEMLCDPGVAKEPQPRSHSCGLPRLGGGTVRSSGDAVSVIPGASLIHTLHQLLCFSCFSLKKKNLEVFSFFNPLLGTLKRSFLTDFFEGHDF